MQHGTSLIKKGAEADIFALDWLGKKAIAKKRSRKNYRHIVLDVEIRRKRTLHEANMMSHVKQFGIRTPLIYFVDPNETEIVMEFIDGLLVKDNPSPRACFNVGLCTGIMHANNVIHGDLTTSNFMMLSDQNLCAFDFGLSFFSNRDEDRAVDIRLIKEVFTSAHNRIFDDAYGNFIGGYQEVSGIKQTEKILHKVRQIEQRGRYSRVV